MKKVPLGRQGLTVSRLGLGCMGMSDFYKGGSEAESVATLERALALGMNFLDTADMYGPFTNEELLGRFLKGRRDQIVLATKFGNMRTPDGKFLGVNGSPDYVRKCCDDSLRRLGVDVIDLYYQHRVDKKTPIEDTMGALAGLVKAGKVRYLGLSEASPATIRRAHKVHPISALQTEYSLWTRDVEAEILPTVRELGIGFVSYSPLGRGFLTGAIQAVTDLAADDWRNRQPRFTGENFDKNRKIVEALEDEASELGVTTAQLVLAWVMAKGEDIVPIPGTKRVARIEENVKALDLKLTQDDLDRLEKAVPLGSAAGDRYPDMSAIDR